MNGTPRDPSNVMRHLHRLADAYDASPPPMKVIWWLPALWALESAAETPFRVFATVVGAALGHAW
jgi:hypothetical protein